MTEKIIIGIGTYKRNELLTKTLEHINRLTPINNCKIEVVISDNNPDKSAYKVFEKINVDFSHKIYYVHEPEKSIAAVRNAVLQKAIEVNADYIAFLDDDEYTEPDWLLELFKTMKEFNADGATSAVIPVCNGQKLPLAHNIKRRKHGSIRKICITNSVLFKTDIVKNSDIWFDTDFGLMTGEDIDFFNRATNLGYKFVWCDKALIYDYIPPERCTLEWSLDRTFNNGYLKIFNLKKYGKNIRKKHYKTLLDLCLFSLINIFVLAFFPQKKKSVC